MLLPQRDGRFRVFGNKDFQLQVKPSELGQRGTSNSNNTTIEITDENRSAISVL